MTCPHCAAEYDNDQKFCRECGARLPVVCPECGTGVAPEDKFCHECGLELRPEENPSPKAPKKLPSARKHVTALFADLTGYTTLSERLDPEEVKEVMGHFFGEVGKIIEKYQGIIEKFAGDAVMALFGLPSSHEDDPIRAIRAATEIHRAVGNVSARVHNLVGEPLTVHIGINSGLVVTGEIHQDDGTHQVAGDTVNVASRLCHLARAGETLVGHMTYELAEGFFSFELLEPFQVKGRTKPVQVYRLVGAKESPRKTHRISGLRADLIGRGMEMARLQEAVTNLLAGQGTFIAVSGEAGTGKSRLIEEFRAGLDADAIQWLQGHAYAYTQNIPYYPLIDLLNRAFRIEESDSPEVTREKAEATIRAVVGDHEDFIPYLGGMLSIPYQEVENITPDAWKAGLQKALLTLLSAYGRRRPTIVSLEDLHWADPSTLELLHFILAKSTSPLIFVCTYRPPLTLFPEPQMAEMGELYREVHLRELSPPETQQMVGSLLGTEAIPSPLQQFIHEKVGGNPFYVEEVVNTLIDGGSLVRGAGGWDFTGPIDHTVVPATINGVIAARLDRLDAATKQVLQEAAVIGRAFYGEILAGITTVPGPIDPHLQKLQDLDLVRVKSVHPDVEYIFKHALIQEAVYNGLLKKERKSIHERIGNALEKFFQERSLEAWETLAVHFKRGCSFHKAVNYLIKSGEKSVRRYALEEANQYYREAFDLLSQKPERTKEEEGLIIDLLMKWCMVFYYQGRFEGMTEFLLRHLHLTESLDDKAKIGAYYGWLGHAAFWQGARLGDSYRYLHKALALGEETGNPQVIGSACSFLIKTCAEMGYLDEAEIFEARTREKLHYFPADIFFQITYYSGKGYLAWFRGDKKKLYDSAQGLIDYGQKTLSLRCLMVGDLIMSFRNFIDQDLDTAIERTRKVITQGDPYYAMFAKLLQGIFLVHRRDFGNAAVRLTEVIENGERERTEYLKTIAHMFLGVAWAAQGRLGEGVKLVEDAGRRFHGYQRTMFSSWAQLILGSIYLQIVERSESKNFSWYVQNLGLLLKVALFAGKKAERHLIRARQLAKDSGANGFLGQPCLQLGLLYQLQGNKEKARAYLEEAVRVFTDCDYTVYLKDAEQLLASLE